MNTQELAGRISQLGGKNVLEINEIFGDGFSIQDCLRFRPLKGVRIDLGLILQIDPLFYSTYKINPPLENKGKITSQPATIIQQPDAVLNRQHNRFKYHPKHGKNL